MTALLNRVRRRLASRRGLATANYALYEENLKLGRAIVRERKSTASVTRLWHAALTRVRAVEAECNGFLEAAERRRLLDIDTGEAKLAVLQNELEAWQAEHAELRDGLEVAAERVADLEKSATFQDGVLLIERDAARLGEHEAKAELMLVTEERDDALAQLADLEDHDPRPVF